MLDPIVPAILGAAAMATFALGLWLPAYVRQRALKRRLTGFVDVGTPAGFAVDMGGRRRQRPAARRKPERAHPITRFLADRIARAHADLTVAEVASAMTIIAALAFVVATIVAETVLVGLVAASLGATLPILWLMWQERRIMAKYTVQLLDTVALLAASVRSGHSFLQALEHVASQAPEPTRGAFALTVREIGLGASQEDALERLADRLPSQDLELIVAAINVHNQIGGSLSRVLDAIGDTIRERKRLAGDIAAFTAQQRYSAYVLSALPLLALGGLLLISPEYISVMFESETLRVVLGLAAAMAVLGFLLLQRFASIDV